MEGPLKELAKLESLTATKGKAPSINDTLDLLLSSLHETRNHLVESEDVDMVTLNDLSRTIEAKKKEVDDRQKEVYTSISRLGKSLEKKFTAPLPTYSRLFESSQSRKALERTIALHFLRTGQFDTSEVFLKESGVDIPSELRSQFVELHRILKVLRNHDIMPALRWVDKNRDFLRSRSSPLEFYLHRSQYIRLLFSSHPPDTLRALGYAKANLRAFYDEHEVEIKRLMGCIVYLPLSRLQASPYGDLASPSLHFELGPLFAKEYCASLGMSRQVPLRVVGDIGGSGALARIEKGRKVMRERKSEWSQTDELPIEIPLLAENRYHSIFACPVSKEQATEQNPPMMMLCGHVIAKESLHKLGKTGGRVKCPYCPTESLLSTALKKMEESLARPPEVLIKNVYSQLLNPGMTSAKMRDSALAGRLLPPVSDSKGVPGRSIAWKFFLLSEEPLQPASSLVTSTSLLHSLRSSRQNFVKRLRKYMRAPDGSYDEGFSLPGFPNLSEKQRRDESLDLETNNPLSLHNENPWKAWFASVELRKTILQDVERTFPEIAFFREPEVQVQLTNILFLYSVMNPSIGYRQGMHEVLAPLYYAVDFDSLSLDEVSASAEDAEIREVCARTWIAGDAWALFDAVMRGLSKWYEWREPPLDSASVGISSPLSTHVNFNVPDGQLEYKPYIAPIVEACNLIQSNYLRKTDPLLWKHIQAAGIEPQIYGIRWLRLLFTREFSMADAMILWDGLFACDPTLGLAQWVCVAMLIRIRNKLIPADYSGQLTVLLRYPSPLSPPAFEDAPHHTSLLLRQALALQMAPSPATGSSLMLENRSLLNIPVDVPAPPPAPLRRRGYNTAGQGRHSPSALQGHSKQATTSQVGIPEMIARGLIEKGESLGINKTLMGAVSELRRNIPEFAASFVRSPGPNSSFPLTDERPPEERPPWEPRTRREMEGEISQLRSTNKRLGESLGWVVDILLQDETASSEPQRLKRQKREALESLSYVRDVLMGDSTELEETRLFSEEETLRRKLRDSRLSQASSGSVVVGLKQPPPVSVVDSRPQTATSRTANTRSRSPNSPVWKASTLPKSNVSNPKARNQSHSGFSSPSLPASESLPRLPPPVGHRPGDQTLHSSETGRDPLGVLQ